ncbi:hypothetical protein [uncultured Brachyspira sp.]|uniref:hypothetical protein n=1 Tax=uncultured Brachyspira sp. TaxID=221953 RepID=UPI0026170465|nr:hypothetical protein [uncultured Brachyspira sp.]
MKEISPTLIENYTTPNLRRLKTDILFFSQVEAQLQNYRPIQFEIVKPESHQISTFSSTAGAFPKFGILKKKRLFPIVGK